MSNIHSCVQKVERNSINFQFDNWSQCLLNFKHVLDMVLFRYVCSEIVKEFLFGNKCWKYTNGVNISTSEVHSQSIRAKDQNLGLFALKLLSVHLLLFNSNLYIPRLNNFL